ncbi:hypothetical protein IGI04_034582 [Brassica rapa subsp. trilocularis]|uniref:Uncharacterized protein n=1 Tax=Brassica rapa subsp. trilocularis TaxID=1813537 RepID=A0ABQ7LA65_BRACM|nr:hypothetical protein IGI04_034582 [Brassica rapa subsp. trilocularis]
MPLQQIYRKLVMKRNQGSEDLDSEKKPLLQSLHLPNARTFVSLISKETGPQILVDESWPCGLSVINGYDSPQSLSAVEDHYLVSFLIIFFIDTTVKTTSLRSLSAVEDRYLVRLSNFLAGPFLIISFIDTTADKHCEDHKPQEQP